MGRPRKSAAKAATPRKPQSVADALFSKTQQRVLGLLFGQSNRQFAKQEIIDLAASGTGAVQRELDRLVQSGLVAMSITGFQKLYRANEQAAIFEELRSIVEKTMGIADAVQRALAPLRERIRLAILYGSVGKDTHSAVSDVDVLVVSDELTLEELLTSLAPVEKRLDRDVSPTLYTTQEFRQRRRAGSPFVTNLLSGKHVVLIGAEDGI